MPVFSKRSLLVQKQLHPLLIQITNEAIKQVDFTLLDAQRGRAEQEKAYRGGFSKARFGESAHNYVPAVAFDLVPYPIDFNNIKGFKDIFAVIGYYDPKTGNGHGLAKELLIPLRAGLDWNMNGKWTDESFLDWGHYELHPWRSFAAKGRLISD